MTIHTADEKTVLSSVGRGLDPAVSLTTIGKIAKEQLLELEKRFASVKIDKYVIMPTHLHAIIRLTDAAGSRPRPTLMDVVKTYKSLTTRLCNQQLDTPGQKRFQTSFYESVLRNEQAYRECWRYIDENPLKWSLDPFDR